jgi:quercetin dioxygenase-like cupin family protein
MNPNNVEQIAAFYRGSATENSLWYQGHLMTVLASGDETGGSFALIDTWALSGNEPPRHVHEREDETFVFIEGHGTFYVGDEVYDVAAGGAIFLPRGVPHSFKIRSERARALILLSPAGFENWFREFSEPAKAMVVPEAHVPSYSDIEAMTAAAPRYGITFLPPSVAETAEAARDALLPDVPAGTVPV